MIWRTTRRSIYFSYDTLGNKGITDFSNTTIALVDTGFDNGVWSGPDVHPDFSGVTLIGTTGFDYLLGDNKYRDQNSHATVPPSLITQSVPLGTRQAHQF